MTTEHAAAPAPKFLAAIVVPDRHKLSVHAGKRLVADWARGHYESPGFVVLLSREADGWTPDSDLLGIPGGGTFFKVNGPSYRYILASSAVGCMPEINDLNERLDEMSRLWRQSRKHPQCPSCLCDKAANDD